MFNLLLNCLLLFLQQHAGLSTSASYVSHMSYHEFDASYVVMRNKFGRVVTLYVGPHHKWSKTCVWVSKCLATNMCHTPFREIGNEASIRVPRMFKSHAWQQYDKQMQCY
jgi:hypothetical protein